MVAILDFTLTQKWTLAALNFLKPSGYMFLASASLLQSSTMFTDTFPGYHGNQSLQNAHTSLSTAGKLLCQLTL